VAVYCSKLWLGLNYTTVTLNVNQCEGKLYFVIFVLAIMFIHYNYF